MKKIGLFIALVYPLFLMGCSCPALLTILSEEIRIRYAYPQYTYPETDEDYGPFLLEREVDGETEVLYSQCPNREAADDAEESAIVARESSVAIHALSEVPAYRLRNPSKDSHMTEAQWNIIRRMLESGRMENVRIVECDKLSEPRSGLVTLEFQSSSVEAQQCPTGVHRLYDAQYPASVLPEPATPADD